MTASSPWFISALASGFPAEREQGKLASVRWAGSSLSNKAAITRPSEAAWPKERCVNQPMDLSLGVDGFTFLAAGLASSLQTCWFWWVWANRSQMKRGILSFGGCCPAWCIAFELLSSGDFCLWRLSVSFLWQCKLSEVLGVSWMDGLDIC